MVKVAVYPPNSLVIADLIERKGHTALALQKEMRKKIKDPEIDSPPMNITEEDPIKGLKYAAIEVPSGVRGRMSIIGPIIDEAEAAILVDNAPKNEKIIPNANKMAFIDLGVFISIS